MAFGAETTTAEVLEGVDLSGKTAVVTGASAGLGIETSKSLASVGAHVVMAVRDADKGRDAAATIKEAVPEASLELGSIDLASLDSVRAFATWLLDRHDRIDLLINNAGVMACPLGRTAEDFEMQLGTNHLGHFVLSTEVAPALLAAAPARVVNLSSRGHQRSDIHWDDPHYRQRLYDKWEAYGQSKTANCLFSVEFDRRYGGRGVHAYAVHPGVIITELARHLTREDLEDLGSRSPSGAPMQFKPVEAGAATSVWAATSPELADVGGVYLEDCQVSTEVTEPRSAGGHTAWALDPASAKRLWEWSEEQVGSGG
ncbi:MAG: SDR family NAD(P)-dependent oxidoreductase [Acidimicrobiia bacterium]|nr:SDR family NAD(P)-dependent oxidoreductase [Acidimicrobiia bacterium]